MSITRKNIFSAFVSIAALCLISTPLAAYSGEDFYVCRLNPKGDNYLSLRTCGSSKCAEIMRLGPDFMVTSMEPWDEQGWREVVTRGYAQDDTGAGTVGWVFEKYICPMD